MSNTTSIAGARIILGVTADVSLSLLAHVPSTLSSMGAEVSVICAPGDAVKTFCRTEMAQVITLPLYREISILKDVMALYKLYFLFRRMRPALIDFGTPKAGLLGMVAGWMAGVPCRIYTLRGLRLETARGWKHRVMVWTEIISSMCAHRVICVSLSLRQRAIDLGLVEPGKVFVLASGTSNGVEIERFLPTTDNLKRAEQVRCKLGLPCNTPVIGFVGRLTRDKGIVELIGAFAGLQEQYPTLCLLLVGDFEDGDPVPQGVRAQIDNSSNIIRTGFVSDTSPYYHLMDVLVLPTYREGFPRVSLEAQAAGKPVVTTHSTGAIDSVQDGKTGFLVPVGDTFALMCAVKNLLSDIAERVEMGRRGQVWVTQEFSGGRVRGALVREYEEAISNSKPT